MAQDPDLLRILISTDNHLGVWEKDETRREDSFRAFEEVLQLAVAKRADLVLLGGDLFHENKPSRGTLVRTIELLSKYCLNDRPVRFRILSDQSVNFVAGRVNFENPNLNVGLPVFTIHGNHDDPSGQDSLSAVDILSQAGLVNYFGKHLLTGSGAARVTLSPILMEKGGTRLCLYGLGNIRDERLGRAFAMPGCVAWQRPAHSQQYPQGEWINVFVLHQNRVQHTPLAKACVKEEHLPGFLDLAVWGHEHECRPDPVVLRGSEDSNRYVVQPGSSVATALSEGESKPKHCLLLEVRRANFRITKLRLGSVRPFEFEHVALRDAAPPLLPEDSDGVGEFLAGKIQEMIDRAAAAHPPPPARDPSAPPPAPLLPLIRLRVDYTGFSTVNSQRLGQRFVGKVANPHDMLQWTKAAARRVKPEGGGGAGGAGGAYDGYDGDGEGGAGPGGYLRPDALDQARIEDLIRQHLGTNALEVLPDDELGLALHNFVEKDDKTALQQCIEQALEETRQAAVAGQELPDAATAGARGAKEEEDLLGAVRAGVERRRKQRLERQAVAAAAGDPDGVDIDALTAGMGAEGGTAAGGGAAGAAAAGGSGARGGRGGRGAAAPAGTDDGFGDGAGPSQATTTTTGRGRGRGGRGGRQQSLADSLARGGRGGRGGSQAGPLDAFLSPASPGKGRGKGAAAATKAGSRGRGHGRGAAAAAASPSASEDDDDVEMAAADSDGDKDVIEDDDDDFAAAAPPAKRAARGGGAKPRAGAAAATPGSASRGRSTRAAATGAGGKARKSYRVADSDDDDDGDASDGVEDIEDHSDEDDDDDDSPPPSAGRGRGRGRGAAAAAPAAARGRGRSTAGAGRGRGAAAAAAAAAAKDVVSVLSSDDDDDDDLRASMMPSGALAHAAAGAAYASSTLPGGGGPTATATGTTTTQGGAGAGGAAPAGGRKRPASFFSSGSTQAGGRGGGAAGGRGWGQAR
ncbi:hypothetical protein HXX76_010017 [Chlamydomonas incerta]|uniref:Mre11 DNA-binding domain-containing protein n=1 Tax=Chlamydomonas incerta TaxID=51695 RepID=A0A835SNW7_CHLIN|nr:hypothetical protein HXX76_010017 [Chlamydomonas incerta]|eukprot:KAG2430494.1 hypothetical protein HXX76_010017 [Chlamydomonas incerta]